MVPPSGEVGVAMRHTPWPLCVEGGWVPRLGSVLKGLAWALPQSVDSDTLGHVAARLREARKQPHGTARGLSALHTNPPLA